MVVILAGTWRFFRQAVHNMTLHYGDLNASWLPNTWRQRPPSVFSGCSLRSKHYIEEGSRCSRPVPASRDRGFHFESDRISSGG